MNLDNKENLKITNLRDYDKEPLIIQDYYNDKTVNKFIFYIILPILIICAIISPSMHDTSRYLLIFLYGFFGLTSIILYSARKLKQPTKNNDFFKFTNSNVSYFNNNKQIKNLDKNNIARLVLSFDRRYDNKYKASKFFVVYLCIFLIVWCGLLIFVYNFYTLIFALLFVYFILFGFKPLLHIHKGGFKSLRFFDQLVIYENEFKGGKIINILVATNDEYNELREYFLQILNIDIDKVPRTFSVFSK
ncbi:MAG: hypothetical protein IJM31_08625 [Campylobacter sp.]|nr:hypothetical protein [Campylobacter sp.]